MITLDRSSPLSLYEQLYRELKKAIISGELPPGKQLPSTRALALQYDISRNTVNTAYSQLLVEGFITSRPGSGLCGKNSSPCHTEPDHAFCHTGSTKSFMHL